MVDDLIKGRAVFDNAELDDLIIFRSDGVPTYNFATVLDDADFGITHVVRGDDHLPNTPRQMQIFYALGLDAAGLRASADGDGARRTEALQAPRRDLGLRLSRRSAIFPRRC